jgi:DNA-binding transcriptional LysR family regulator
MVSPVCATPEYLEQYGKPDTPDELVNHKCLLLAMPGFNRSNWKFTDKQGHTKEVVVKEFLCTSNAIALKQCVLAGMGITLQAGWMVGRELRDGSLIDLFPDHDVTAALDEAAAWVLYPSRNYVPQKVRVFVDFFKEKFQAGAPWDQSARGN